MIQAKVKKYALKKLSRHHSMIML